MGLSAEHIIRSLAVSVRSTPSSVTNFSPSAAERTIERESSRLRLAVELVEAHNPQQILRRGFAVVRLGGKAMTHTEGVKCGEQIEIELSNGTLQAEVKKITTKQ